MDTTREVLILTLERLRYIEKMRQSDIAQLLAVARTIQSLSPAVREHFQSELIAQETKVAHPAQQLTDLYDELITLLKNPDPSGEDEQEKFRRLLESFEGPPQ